MVFLSICSILLQFTDGKENGTSAEFSAYTGDDKVREIPTNNFIFPHTCSFLQKV